MTAQCPLLHFKDQSRKSLLSVVASKGFQPWWRPEIFKGQIMKVYILRVHILGVTKCVTRFLKTPHCVEHFVTHFVTLEIWSTLNHCTA